MLAIILISDSAKYDLHILKIWCITWLAYLRILRIWPKYLWYKMCHLTNLHVFGTGCDIWSTYLWTVFFYDLLIYRNWCVILSINKSCIRPPIHKTSVTTWCNPYPACPLNLIPVFSYSLKEQTTSEYQLKAHISRTLTLTSLVIFIVFHGMYYCCVNIFSICVKTDQHIYLGLSNSQQADVCC